jgi:ATP-grasp domain, R2K clade family 2
MTIHALIVSYDNASEEVATAALAFPNHRILSRDELWETGPKDLNAETTIIVADIFVMAWVFSTFGSWDGFQEFPTELAAHYGRSIRRVDVATVFDRFTHGDDGGTPLFVKSARQKGFCGVVHKLKDLPMSLAIADADEPVFVADVVSFGLEYRGFLVDGVFLERRSYGQHADANDPRLVAPPYAAEIAAAAHFPTGAHIVDFGFIGDATEPSIVEINPPFSFGTYGCRPETMRAVLETGWRARMTGRTASRDEWFPKLPLVHLETEVAQ